MAVLKFYRLPKYLIAFIVGNILAYMLLPFLLTLLFPMFFYRWLIFLSAKMLKPELSKMVNRRGTVFGVFNPYTSPKLKLVYGIVLEGSPTTQVIQVAIKKALETRDDKTGELLYPELKQQIKNWMGYLFWKPIPNFKLDDYISYHETPNDTPKTPMFYEQVNDLIKEESFKPYCKGRALWKCIIIRNYSPKTSSGSYPLYYNPNKTYSLMTFCTHHVLMDGFSTLKFFQKISDSFLEIHLKKDKSLEYPQLYSFFKKIYFCLSLFFKVPYDMGSMVIKEMASITGIWNNKKDLKYSETETIEIKTTDSDSDKNEKFYPLSGYATELIPFSRIKEMRNKHVGVNCTAIVMAAVAGSIRNGMFQNKKIPKMINIGMAIPLQGHPDKLRNYVSGTNMSLPIGTEDPLKRLEIINRQIQRISSSTLPLFISFMMVVVGSLPIPFLRFISEPFKSTFETAFITNFPGPLKEVQMFGCTFKELYFSCAGMLDTQCLGMAFITYAGYGRLTVGGDKKLVLSDQHAERLGNLFIEELEILGKSKGRPQLV